MATETVLTYRRAKYRGERGLFADDPSAEADLQLAKLDDQVVVHWYSTANAAAKRFLWLLVHTVAEATNRWLDKDEAMRDLKMRAAYTKWVYDSKKHEVELRPKSLTRINGEELRSLTDKFIDIICEQILPHMKPSQLRRKVEEMLGLTK